MVGGQCDLHCSNTLSTVLGLKFVSDLDAYGCRAEDEDGVSDSDVNDRDLHRLVIVMQVPFLLLFIIVFVLRGITCSWDMITGTGTQFGPDIVTYLTMQVQPMFNSIMQGCHINTSLLT